MCIPGPGKTRPQSPVSEVVFQQTVTVIPPEALHTISSAPLSNQLETKVGLFFTYISIDVQMFLTETEMQFSICICIFS